MDPEAVAETLVYGPDRTAAVVADARAAAEWRSAFMLPPPMGRLADAIESLHRVALADASAEGPPGI